VNVSRLTAAILTAGALAPAAASADFPDQRPAGDPMLLELRDEAGDYWTRAGVPGCAPDVHLATIQPFGYGGPCTIIINADFAGQQLGRARRPFHYLRPRAALRLRRWTLAMLACVVVHEVGHARGLPHADTGVMRPVLDVNDDCRAIARRLIPRTPERTR
jgi:hypothetical protein